MELLNYDKSIIGSTGLAVGDFWRWAYSDIMSNRNRAVFGEFLIASAIGAAQKPRTEWDAVDVVYNKIKIEVKTAAYLQSWHQDKLSLIRFDLAKKKSWYAETNTFSKEATRPSDIYVFCLFTEKDKEKADILNLSQWEFYIIATTNLDKIMGDAKSISLNRLKELVIVVSYDQLKSKIDECLRHFYD
jgi:hypothetical protein